MVANGATLSGRRPVLPGKLVASSVMAPMLQVWWLRPVSSATRGRRTQGCGVKLIIAQTLIGQTLCRRHVDGPAERTGLAESHIVDEYDQHIWRTCRRLDIKSRRCCCVSGI